MIEKIPLTRIEDNPFQPRRTYADISELAEKIKAMKAQLPHTLGLIHIPNARRLPDGTIQLAEGHRRLRAFMTLEEFDPDYAVMPLNLIELDDEAMDTVAWDENVDRQDLTPVELARALKKTQDSFGLSVNDLATRRQMGRSSVSNKLRLLKLPEPLLEAIHQGDVSERVGVAYLPLVTDPPDDRDLDGLTPHQAFRVWETPTPQALLARLLDPEPDGKPLTSTEVRQKVEDIQRQAEQNKLARWQQDREDKQAGDDLAAKIGTIPAPTSDGAPVLPPKPPSAPVVPSAPPASPAPAPMPAPSPTPTEPPQPPVMQPIEPSPPTETHTIVTVRLTAKPGHFPHAFTLSVGQEGSDAFPRFSSGAYDRLIPTLTEALNTEFAPATLLETELMSLTMEEPNG